MSAVLNPVIKHRRAAFLRRKWLLSRRMAHPVRVVKVRKDSWQEVMICLLRYVGVSALLVFPHLFA